MLLEKKQYEWQHLVLAVCRSLCPTMLSVIVILSNARGITSSNLHNFFKCEHKISCLSHCKIYPENSHCSQSFHLQKGGWVAFWCIFVTSLAAIFPVIYCVLTIKNTSRALLLENTSGLFHNSCSLYAVLPGAIQKLLHKWLWDVWYLLPSSLLQTR